MAQRESSTVEVIDLEPGLWIWRIEHPGWGEGVDWQKVVTCVCVDAGGERWLIDPLLPLDDANQVWDRLAERPPTAVAVLLPDHLRPTFDDPHTWSIDAVVCRFGCPAFGPDAWDTDGAPPQTEVRTIEPGHPLPGGLVPLWDPRGWHETPLWLPEQRTLVFGDGMTERGGTLRAWMSPTHEERALPDLRAMLDLPFERVIMSHGEPVHTRGEFEAALELPPWPASSLHISAWRGDLEQVRKLVGMGLDPMATADDSDATPLDWALNASRAEWSRRPGHDDLITYLRSVTGKGGDSAD